MWYLQLQFIQQTTIFYYVPHVSAELQSAIIIIVIDVDFEWKTYR